MSSAIEDLSQVWLILAPNDIEAFVKSIESKRSSHHSLHTLSSALLSSALSFQLQQIRLNYNAGRSLLLLRRLTILSAHRDYCSIFCALHRHNRSSVSRTLSSSVRRTCRWLQSWSDTLYAGKCSEESCCCQRQTETKWIVCTISCSHKQQGSARSF